MDPELPLSVEIIEVTNNDFSARVREIQAAGGHIENTKIISGGYLLRVRWTEPKP